MLFQRNYGTDDGWEFVAYLADVPKELFFTTKEYCYFWIG